MPLHEPEQRTHLLGLGLPLDLLEVQQLRNRRVDVDVVASTDPGETEPEGLRQAAGFREREIVRRLERLQEQLSRVHPTILTPRPTRRAGRVRSPRAL